MGIPVRQHLHAGIIQATTNSNDQFPTNQIPLPPPDIPLNHGGMTPDEYKEIITNIAKLRFTKLTGKKSAAKEMKLQQTQTDFARLSTSICSVNPDNDQDLRNLAATDWRLSYLSMQRRAREVDRNIRPSIQISTGIGMK